MSDQCQECGMIVDNAAEYHPYTACVLFKYLRHTSPCGAEESCREMFRAADEIASLRARLERAKDALISAHCDCITMKGKNYICKRCLALRELESEGGGK